MNRQFKLTGQYNMPQTLSHALTHDLSWMTARPIAHRGFHDAENSIYENTLSACKRAIDHGFNIEVDLHPSSDGNAVVFHDFTLERLANSKQEVRTLTTNQLSKTNISNSSDHIATLDELLDLTNGKVGLVLELKGVAGEDDGFVQAVVNSLENYQGPFAIMSFYHWLLIDAHKIAPQIPLGLTALGDDENYKMHKSIAEQCGVDFVSYKWKHLPNKFAAEFKQSGKPLICWTTKSPSHLSRALPLCDQVTFEGFDPDKL